MKRYSQSFTRVVHVLLVVALLLTFAAPAFAEGGPTLEKTDISPLITKQNSPWVVRKAITKFPSAEDAFWPITRIERTNSIDEKGIVHKHVTIIREKLLPIKQVVPCDSVNVGSNLGTCYLLGQVTQDDIDYAGGITSHQKHFADKYKCPSHNCIGGGIDIVYFYKMTRVENWWIRNDPTLSVSDADFLWGCTGNCYECGVGPNYYEPYTNHIENVGWSNSTHSWTYIYSSDGWPVWAGSTDITFLVGAHMDSNWGSLSVQTAWMN